MREVGDPKCLSESLVLAMLPLPDGESTEDFLRRIPVGVEEVENDAIVIFWLIQEQITRIYHNRLCLYTKLFFYISYHLV